MDDRPVVCVDLNGVLDSYTGWRHEKHWDPPRSGAAEFLRGLDERGYRVVVFTTRWADDARAWLAEHGLDRWVSEVTDKKPAAHVFVDDRVGREGAAKRPAPPSVGGRRGVLLRGALGEPSEGAPPFRGFWGGGPPAL